MRKKIFAIFLCITLLFSPIYSKPAQALIPTMDYLAELMTGLTDISTWGKWLDDIGSAIKKAMIANAVLLNKVGALIAVQKATSLLIGDGNDGTIIRDFNNYLYISPQQRAMAQMNSFFNTVSRGRLSTLNYEGVGPNYDAYLVAQARQAIGGQSFVTNIQDQVTDPKKMFAAGNMKGIMAYMECPNNVACYTMVSSAQYKKEFTKAQEIAKNENVNGFIPKKTNGRIIQPAALAQNALLQIDQLGTQIIMNADADDGLTAIEQVWTGAGISAAARLTNYGISDTAGRDAIRNKNNQFPFSLAYDLKNGIGISAGGVTVSTGTGAINLQLQIGNTCAQMFGDANASGAQVTIQGRKYNCATKSEVTSTAPSIGGSLPAVTCTSDSDCANIPGFVGKLRCNTAYSPGKCVFR